MIGTPRFVTKDVAESSHNQAGAFRRHIDVDADAGAAAVESSLARACRERESVDEEKSTSIVWMSRHDVKNTVNYQLERARGDEYDRTVVLYGGQSVAAALAAIDDGNHLTLASELTEWALAGAEAVS